jgi:hypothetical protein
MNHILAADERVHRLLLTIHQVGVISPTYDRGKGRPCTFNSKIRSVIGRISSAESENVRRRFSAIFINPSIAISGFAVLLVKTARAPAAM